MVWWTFFNTTSIVDDISIISPLTIFGSLLWLGFLFFIIAILSILIGWIIGSVLRLVFCWKIENNEYRRDIFKTTHKSFVWDFPLNLKRMTLNRTVAIEKMVSLGFLVLGTFLLIHYHGIYGIIITIITPLTFLGVYIYTRSTAVSEEFSSFRKRFVVLWYDKIRIGEYLEYKENFYMIFSFGITEAGCIEINKEDLDKRKKVNRKFSKIKDIVKESFKLEEIIIDTSFEKDKTMAVSPSVISLSYHNMLNPDKVVLRPLIH